jgi:hypothetical protein
MRLGLAAGTCNMGRAVGNATSRRHVDAAGLCCIPMLLTNAACPCCISMESFLVRKSANVKLVSYYSGLAEVGP